MATATWLGGNTDWSVGGDWQGGTGAGGIPGPTDDVLISNAGTLTHSIGNDHVRSITISTSELNVTGGVLVLTGFLSENGTLALSGGVLTLGGGGGSVGGTMTQTGGTLVLRGGKLSVTGFATFAGKITGGGGIDVSSGSVTLGAGANLGMARLTEEGGSLTLGANTAYARSFATTGGTLALAGHTLTLTGAATFGNAATVQGGGTVAVSDAVLDGVHLRGGVALQVFGTALLLSSVVLGPVAGDTASISVLAAATLSLTGGAGVATASAAARLTNAGVIGKTGGPQTSTLAVTVASTGSIVVDGGALVLTAAGNALGGTISGAGQLVVRGGTDRFMSGLAISVASMSLAGGTSVVAGVASDTGAFQLSGAAVLTMAAKSRLTLSGGASFTAAGTQPPTRINGAGVVGTSGRVEINNLLIDGSAQLAISGTAEQTGALTVGASAGAIAALVIAKTGVYRIEGGLELSSDVLTAKLINAGTVVRTGAAGLAEINVATINSGTIEGRVGDLQFLQSVSGGLVNIDAGALVGFENQVSSSTTVGFTGNDGVLRIGGDFAAFGATIAGFAAGAEIELSSFDPTLAHVTGFTGGVLTVTDGSNTAHLHIAGTGLTTASFSLGFAESGVAIFHT